jgi:hypothetical protein
MCQSTTVLLGRLGMTEGVTVQPWQEAGIDDSSLSERIRAEILLLDLHDSKVYGGLDALIRLCESQPRWQWLGAILKLPVLHFLAMGVYQTIAQNRRIVSPIPPRPIPCSCDPPENPAARSRFYILCVLLYTIGWCVLMLAASRAGLTTLQSHLWEILGLSEVVGWLLAVVGLAAFFRPYRVAFFQQSMVVLALGGVLFLMVAGLVSLETYFFGPPLLLSPLLLALQPVVMLTVLRRRLRILALPDWMPWCWLLLATVCFILLTRILH